MGLVKLARGKDERRQRLGAKLEMAASSEVDRAPGILSHCELAFEVNFS